MAFYPTLPLRVVLCGDNGMRVVMTASEFKAWLAEPEPACARVGCVREAGHAGKHVIDNTSGGHPVRVRTTSEKDPE